MHILHVIMRSKLIEPDHLQNFKVTSAFSAFGPAAREETQPPGNDNLYQNNLQGYLPES